MLAWIVIVLAIASVGWLMVRSRSRVKWLIALAVVMALIPIAIVASLLYTETGLRLAQGQLSRLERYGVHIEEVTGRLAGPLYVKRFELDHPNVHIVSHDLVIHLQLRQLLLQTIGVSALSARDTLVEIRRAPPTPPPARPLRFLPNFLRITVDAAEFHRLRYVNIDGTAVDARIARGDATLTSRRIRVPRFQASGDWFEIDGNLLLAAQRPLGIELTTHGKIDHRDIRYVVDASLDGTIDELGIKATVHQPTRASADVTLTRPDDRWRIAGKVSSDEFSLQPWVERPPFMLRDVALDVIVDPQGIQAKGRLAVPELDAKPMTIDAAGRYAQRSIQIDSVDLRLADSPMRLRASGSVALNGEHTLIDARAAWSDLQWPLRGTPVATSTAGSGSLHGSMPYKFTLDTQVAGPNIPPASGTASGTITQSSVTLDAFDVGTLGGRISGTGALSFAQPRTWKLEANVAEVDPAAIDARFPGRINARFAAHGAGLDKTARFSVTLGDLQGLLRQQQVRANGGIERTARGWHVRNARLSFGDARLALNGTLGDAVHATWSLQAPSLEALLPDAHGSLAFTGSANGPLKSPQVVVDLRGERVGYKDWRAQTIAVNGDVDLAGRLASRLSIDARSIGAASPLIQTLRVTGDGTAADHRLAVELQGRTTTSREPAAHAHLAIAGRYVDASWYATITSTDIHAGGDDETLALVEPATLVLDRKGARLDPLCFALGNGRLCAEAKWQRDGPWEAIVSGYELPLAEFLPPPGREAEYAGRIEGRVRAFGNPNSVWQGEAGMRIVDAAVIYRPQGGQAETLNLGTGGLAATATPERINFSFGVQAFTDTFLFANATLDRRTTQDLLHSPLVGDFRARAADANILPIVVDDIDNAAGLLTANGNVRGTLAAPQFDGRIELANGELDSYRVNLALRNLNLVANLASNAIYFNGSGRAGEGELNASGSFAWTDGVSRGNLQIRGKDLLVADLPEYRVVASPDLAFVIDGRNIDATGTVLIPSARIQPANLTGAVQVSDDARYVGEHSAEIDGRFVVRSEIRIVMGDDVRIDSFGLQGRILGAVTTTLRTHETTTGRGELSVDQGRYEAYGQKLEIARGKLLFEGSPLSDPGLDIEARRKIETVTVGLNVRGTLQQPRLSFFSEPSMSQTQIVSYLLTGKSLESMGSSDAAAVSSATDALAVQGGGLLASQIGRRIGLEEVGVESKVNSAGETNQQLVLGKFLSPRLFVSYGISLTESINTLKLRYTISDRWVLKTEAGEHQSADIEFTVER